MFSALHHFSHLGFISELLEEAVASTGFSLRLNFSDPNGNGLYNLLVFG